MAEQIENHYPAFSLIDTVRLARQILSHPDLYIKVACPTCKGNTYVNYNLATCPDCINGYNLIHLDSLAEALKEEKPLPGPSGIHLMIQDMQEKKDES